MNTILTQHFRFVSAAPYFDGNANPLSSDAGSLLGGVGFLHVRPSTVSPLIVFSVFGQLPESSLVQAKKRENVPMLLLPVVHRQIGIASSIFSGSVGSE